MAKEKIKIGFLGYGTRALDALMQSELYEVRHFFVPVKNLCEDVREAHRKYPELDYREIRNKEELSQAFTACADVDCFLMNACSIILNAEILMKKDVYNIHPGSLEYNRGHHPHLWTVRLQEKETEINLHKVTEKIDLGEVISSVRIPVTAQMDELQVLNAAEDHIPELLADLYSYLRKNQNALRYVHEGVYRRTMIPEDYEILWDKDPVDVVRAKVLCRAKHHGAFFRWNACRIYVDAILAQELCKTDQNKIEIAEEAQSVEVIWGGIRYLFHLNRILSEREV